MEISNETVVNLEGNNEFVRVYAKQYDKDSRKLTLEFTQNGTVWQIPQGVTARFAMTKPDGEQILNDAVVSDNAVEVELTYQMLSAAGNAKCEVQFYSGEEMLSSAVFDLVVSRAAYSKEKIESSSEYESFIHALLEIDVKIDGAEQAANAANTAAGKANTAATSANNAAKSANTAAGTANTAASAANSAAGTAKTQGDYAKTQGDYAKTQGDRAKSEADRLEDVDVAGLQDQIDALPGKYVQLTNLTQLTEQNLTLETLNPGNYYALSAVANTFADKPEGVTLAQSYVTVYWDFWTTGNTTKRIELINRGDGRKWYKSYDGTKWGNWIEYTRNEEIADKTKLTQYTSWTDLGVPVTSDYATIVNAMINNSVAILPVNSTDNNPNHPTQYGTLEILKTNFGPVHFTFTRPYNGFFDKWCGTYRADLGFSGWKEVTFQEEIEDKTKLTQYTSWTDLGLKEGEAGIDDIFSAMSNNSVAILSKTSTTEQGEFPYKWGMLTVTKSGRNRSTWEYVLNNAGNVVRRWVGGYSESMEPKWTGWKEITFGGYETGTWTPTLAGSDSSGAGAFRYTTREGTYCKLGNLVYLSGEIRGTVQTAPTGYYNILGIPFTCSKFPQSNVMIPYSSGGEEESFRNFRNAGVNGNKLELIDKDGYTAINTKIQCASGNNFAIVFSGWYRTEE